MSQAFGALEKLLFWGNNTHMVMQIEIEISLAQILQMLYFLAEILLAQVTQIWKT